MDIIALLTLHSSILPSLSRVIQGLFNYLSTLITSEKRLNITRKVESKFTTRDENYSRKELTLNASNSECDCRSCNEKKRKKKRYVLHAYHEKFFSQIHGAVVAKFKKITTTSSNLTLI